MRNENDAKSGGEVASFLVHFLAQNQGIYCQLVEILVLSRFCIWYLNYCCQNVLPPPVLHAVSDSELESEELYFFIGRSA